MAFFKSNIIIFPFGQKQFFDNQFEITKLRLLFRQDRRVCCMCSEKDNFGERKENFNERFGAKRLF